MTELMTPGMTAAVAERRRQIEDEHFLAFTDDQYTQGELVAAAICYLLNLFNPLAAADLKDMWPWAPRWWKPKNRKRDIERACALLMAELDRMERAEAAEKADG